VSLDEVGRGWTRLDGVVRVVGRENSMTLGEEMTTKDSGFLHGWIIVGSTSIEPSTMDL